MSRWTHAICRGCWEDRHGGKVPERLKDAEAETCCVCGGYTRFGAYFQENPEVLRCKGSVGNVHIDQ